jgi:hypothetical protein
LSDVRDFGIAVKDAVRLNDCYAILNEAFAKRDPVDGDDADWWSQPQTTDTSPEGMDWLHRWRSANVADMTLRRAIANRELPLWVRLEHSDELIDPGAIKEVNRDLIVTGAYLPMNDRQSWLVGRPLWVKRVVWERFFRAVMARRFGDEPLPNLVQTLAMPIPAALDGAGPVMGLEEAINLEALGQPSGSILVMANDVGDMRILSGDGEPLPPSGPGSGGVLIEALWSAHSHIRKALQSGDLRSYVQGDNGEALAIRPLYWLHGNPERLDIAYRGMRLDDSGVGNPVLISRGEFANWQAAGSKTVSAAKRGRVRHSAMKVQRPRISDKALQAWFDRLTDTEKAMAADNLWTYCKSANPRKSITREQVRALVPHRKQGPRPIR